MERKSVSERVKPEIKEYIINLAKAEEELYKKYIKDKEKNKNTICEDVESYNKEIKNINHPHDKAIRNILADKQEAAILINEVLELEGQVAVKPNELAEYKTDFVTEDYFNREIDIIYQDLTRKNIFYLIEHQSKVDYRMSMRLIEYYNEVIKNTYKNREPQKKYEMPIIIPIVIYTGNGKWNAATSLRKEQVRGILPLELGSYKVFDVNNYSDEELIEGQGILTKVLSLEKAKNLEQVEEKTDKIAKCELNEKEKLYLNQYIRHIMSEEYGKDETDKILMKINKNIREEKSMLIDVFNQVEERGMKKGLEKGERRGIIKSRKVVVINMLKNNYSDKEIKKISEVSDEELEKIKKSLKQ